MEVQGHHLCPHGAHILGNNQCVRECYTPKKCASKETWHPGEGEMSLGLHIAEEDEFDNLLKLSEIWTTLLRLDQALTSGCGWGGDLGKERAIWVHREIYRMWQVTLSGWSLHMWEKNKS